MNWSGANQGIGHKPNGQGIPPQISEGLPPAIAMEKTLRRLFLTLFLRGRSSRGLSKDKAPKSVGSKLTLTLLLYAMVGLMAIFFRGQPVFTLSIYLHGM